MLSPLEGQQEASRLEVPSGPFSQGIPLVSISQVRGGVPLVYVKTFVSSNKMMDSPPVFA
jgi:hypothetical protein